MFYTYVLKSEKDGKLYIGHTENVIKRTQVHNLGKVPSTKHRTPFTLLFQTAFTTRNQARWQERKWKSAWGHKQLEKILSGRSAAW